jgi:hypothetical protein
LAAGRSIAVGLAVWFLAGAGAWSVVLLLPLRLSTAGSAEEEGTIESEVGGRDLAVAGRDLAVAEPRRDLPDAALLMQDEDVFGGPDRSVSNRGS